MATRSVSVRLEAITADYQRKMAQATIATKGLGTSLDSVPARMDATGKSMMKFGGIATLGVTLPLVGIAKQAIETTATFDKTMRTMGAVAGVPGPKLEQLGDLAKKMGANTVFSANEAASAMLELSKAGVRTADIMGGGLKNTLDLATAGDLELAEAATVASNAMNVFNLSGKRSQIAADALAGAANASSADVRDLAMALAQGGNAAANAGFSIQETTAILGAFADQGIKGSDASTSLKTMLLSLVPSTDSARAMMQKLGIDFVDASGSIKSAAEVAQELKDGLGGLTQAQQQTALKTMFGTDAFRAASVMMGLGAKGLAKYTEETSKVGNAHEVAERKMGGVAGVMEQMRGAWETFLLEIGPVIVPLFTDVAGTATDMLKAFSDLSPASRELAVKVGIAGAAFGPLLTGLGGVVRLISHARLVSAIQGIGTASTAAATGLGAAGGAGLVGRLGMFGGLLSPAGAVIGGLGLLAAGYARAQMNAAKFDAAVAANVTAIQAGEKSFQVMATRVDQLRAEVQAQQAAVSRNADVWSDWTGTTAQAGDKAIDVSKQIRELKATEEELDRIIRRKITTLELSVRGLDAAKRKTIETYVEEGNYTVALKLLAEEERKARRALEERTEAMKGHNIEAIRARQISRDLEEATKDAAREDRQHAKDISDKEARSAELLTTMMKLDRKFTSRVETPGLVNALKLTQEWYESLRKITAMGTIRAEAQFHGGPIGDGFGLGAAPAGTPISMMNWAIGKFDNGLVPTSGYRPGAITSSGNPSLHGIAPPNNAWDFAGPASAMLAAAQGLAGKFGSGIRELIHTPLGYSIKNGVRVPPIAASDHYDHVHIADMGARIRGPGLVKIGAITEDVHFVPRSGPGAVAPLYPTGKLTPAGSGAPGGSQTVVNNNTYNNVGGRIEIVLEDGKRLRGYIQDAAFDGFRQAARARRAS
jgi:TP901 family phage tail tape measure protein